MVAGLGMPLVFFGGFFIAEDDAPFYWRWAFSVSPFYYSFTATLRVNLQNYGAQQCDDASVDASTSRAAVAAAAAMVEHTLPSLLALLAGPCALVDFLRCLPVCWTTW